MDFKYSLRKKKMCVLVQLKPCAEDSKMGDVSFVEVPSITRERPHQGSPLIKCIQRPVYIQGA